MSQHRLACGDKMGKVYELDNAYTRNFKLKKTCYFAWISEYDKTTALYVYLITYVVKAQISLTCQRCIRPTMVSTGVESVLPKC